MKRISVAEQAATKHELASPKRASDSSKAALRRKDAPRSGGAAHSSLDHYDGPTLMLFPAHHVRLEDIADVALNDRKVVLSSIAVELLKQGRARLEAKIAANEVIYGVNTGFGGNSHCIIPASQDATFFRVDFDTLSERAEVITTVAVSIGPLPLAGLPGKRFGWRATFRVRYPRSYGRRSA